MTLTTYIYVALCIAVFAGGCDHKGAADGTDGGSARATDDTNTDTSNDTGSGTEAGDTNPFPESVVLETLSRNPAYAILEGPVWDKDDTLYFSDVDNNTVYQYRDGTATLFRSASNGTNGLMYDLSGRLCACEGAAGRLTALDASGGVAEVLTDAFDGARYNRPNDLVFDQHGGVYFTDPTWDMVHPQDVNGVYYRSAGGEVTRLVADMNKPNGIMLSPDQDVLYVDDWAGRYVRAYDITGPGVLANQRDFAELKTEGMAGGAEADGMAVDTAGNLYVATAGGIQVFSPLGRYIDMVEVPDGPTNCTFGGGDMKTLFITTRPALFSVTMRITGIQFPR